MKFYSCKLVYDLIQILPIWYLVYNIIFQSNIYLCEYRKKDSLLVWPNRKTYDRHMISILPIHFLYRIFKK
jgi:hypothetical protein